MTNKSILIDSKAHQELANLTKSLNMNFGSLVTEMIYYFKKTGINPKNSVNENPSIMVAALDKRIVSFLKVQERDILKPLRQDVFNYQNFTKEDIAEINKRFDNLLVQHSERVKRIVDLHNQHIALLNKNDVARINYIKDELVKVIALLNKIHQENIQNLNMNTKLQNERAELLKIELEKNRKAIILFCQLLDDKNKSGAMDKLKNIFN